MQKIRLAFYSGLSWQGWVQITKFGGLYSSNQYPCMSKKNTMQKITLAFYWGLNYCGGLEKGQWELTTTIDALNFIGSRLLCKG